MPKSGACWGWRTGGVPPSGARQRAAGVAYSGLDCPGLKRAIRGVGMTGWGSAASGGREWVKERAWVLEGQGVAVEAAAHRGHPVPTLELSWGGKRNSTLGRGRARELAAGFLFPGSLPRAEEPWCTLDYSQGYTSGWYTSLTLSAVQCLLYTVPAWQTRLVPRTLDAALTVCGRY